MSRFFIIFSVLIWSAETVFAADPSPINPLISTDKAQFLNAMESYHRVEIDPPSQKYSQELFNPYYARYEQVLRDCFSIKEPPASNAPFTFVLTLDATGHISAIHLNTLTNTADCLLEKVATDSFPPPPYAPFFEKIEMHFSP